MSSSSSSSSFSSSLDFHTNCAKIRAKYNKLAELIYRRTQLALLLSDSCLLGSESSIHRRNLNDMDKVCAKIAAIHNAPSWPGEKSLMNVLSVVERTHIKKSEPLVQSTIPSDEDLQFRMRWSLEVSPQFDPEHGFEFVFFVPLPCLLRQKTVSDSASDTVLASSDYCNFQMGEEEIFPLFSTRNGWSPSATLFKEKKGESNTTERLLFAASGIRCLLPLLKKEGCKFVCWLQKAKPPQSRPKTSTLSLVDYLSDDFEEGEKSHRLVPVQLCQSPCTD
jgi:hypothetical protein